MTTSFSALKGIRLVGFVGSQLVDFIFQVFVKEINARDFNADANSVRDWVAQAGFPKDCRMECG